MYNIKVETSNPYEVKVGSGLLTDVGKLTKELHPLSAVAIITDSNVAPLYLDIVRDSYKKQGFTVFTYIIPAGEQSKNMQELTLILDYLAQCQMGRSDLLVALGGGVVGDITGFAAATFQRGIDFVQIPTSLLSAVDSSVGGKTAVNLPSGKNLVGAFWQPILVVCDTESFNTLPKEEIASGAAECIKYALLHDRQLLEELTKNGFETCWDRVINSCVLYKPKVVMQDERELGVRKLLNLGHTFGHAIEKLTHYNMRHGDAVAIGMLFIAKVCAEKSICGQEIPHKVKNAIEKFMLPTTCSFSAKDIAEAALNDKKRQGNQITLVLIRDIGECFTQNIPVDELTDWVSIGMKEATCK